MSLKTILSKMNNKTNLASQIKLAAGNAESIAKGVGIALGAAGVADYVINEGGNRARSKRYTDIQEMNNKKQDEYRRRKYRTPQELYGYKTGHSNSWGGNKY